MRERFDPQIGPELPPDLYRLAEQSGSIDTKNPARSPEQGSTLPERA